MIEALKMWTLALLIIWMGVALGVFIADMTNGYRLIMPNENVQCVSVSRLFNTSIDCWKIKGE